MHSILPLVARPGVGQRDHTVAECGCAFTVTSTDDIRWDQCAAHAFAPELLKVAKAARANVRLLPALQKAIALRAPMYHEIDVLLKSVEAYKEREP